MSQGAEVGLHAEVLQTHLLQNYTVLLRRPNQEVFGEILQVSCPLPVEQKGFEFQSYLIQSYFKSVCISCRGFDCLNLIWLVEERKKKKTVCSQNYSHYLHISHFCFADLSKDMIRGGHVPLTFQNPTFVLVLHFQFQLLGCQNPDEV